MTQRYLQKHLESKMSIFSHNQSIHRLSFQLTYDIILSYTCKACLHHIFKVVNLGGFISTRGETKDFKQLDSDVLSLSGVQF